MDQDTDGLLVKG